MEISRREFLKLLGITGSAAIAGTWGARSLLDVPDDVFERVLNGSLIESWTNSICTRCPGGCGIRARLIDGIPVRVLGNPNHPVNRGAVCTLAEADIETLFHPDRIKQPLKRVGKRGNDEWEPISWEAAIDLLSDRLVALRRAGEREKLVAITSDHNDLTSVLLRQFMSAYGSPNLINQANSAKAGVSLLLTQGLHKKPIYDYERAGLILNFDQDLLDDPISPVRFNRLYGNSSAKIIHFSSYQSRTAVKSSEWHPIEAGTAAALALGIANVVVRDGTYNRSFIDKKAFGFEDWKDASGQEHLGFKRLVLTEYSPEKVAGITGVPATTIIDIARKFAENKQAIAISGGQSAESTNGAYTLFAIYCLNALKGNLNQRGGVLFHDLSYLPEFFTNSAGSGTTIGNFTSLERLLAKSNEAGSNLVDTLILFRSNPAFASSRTSHFNSFLNRVPFIVSVNSFFDESTAQADLVLPEPSQLERWDASLMTPAVDHPVFGIQHPVLNPIDNTRQFGDVILGIAETLGGDVRKQLPWDDFPAFIKTYAKAIYTSGEGAIISENTDYSWIEFLKERGWQSMEYSSFSEFWELLLQEGGWSNPAYALCEDNALFKTRSGKFEFFSTALAAELNTSFPGSPDKNDQLSRALNERKIDARGDYVFLPHYEIPRQEKTNLPYQLLTYRIIGTWDQSGATLGLIQEMAGLHAREYWNPWAELNPETAHSIGIGEDDFIEVISKNGTLTVKVKVRPTVMPGMVVLPLARFSGRNAENTHTLITPEMDLISGVGSMISTRVRIRPVISGKVV